MLEGAAQTGNLVVAVVKGNGWEMTLRRGGWGTSSLLK